MTNVIDQQQGNNWALYQGDSVQVIKGVPKNSIDFTIYSPPFSQLFIYSNSEADMGNSQNDDEFFAHYDYLIEELHRVTVPGRLSAVHCSDLPNFKYQHGIASLRDFPGDIIRHHIKYGWEYHSRITIWKDPVIEMQRTKSHGLLHKTFAANTENCRVGMPDYMLIFKKPYDDGEGKQVKQNRKPGDYIGTSAPLPSSYMTRTNLFEDAETGELTEEATMNKSSLRSYSIEVWQRYASPVWFDIDQTNTLNYRIAKGNGDEKHICPLQLDVIGRCIDLWTNEGETILSPFAGIGSEGYEALRLGRRFVGIELKDSYFNIAAKYLQEAEQKANQIDLFTWAANQP